MGIQELERLEDLTMSLLCNHKASSSKDFMEVYDTIYSHCTEATPIFETRGAKVYECLKKTLLAYVDGLRCFTSLKTLHSQLLEFSNALDLVAKAYSYLERYFIRISLERRDGHIQDIRTLGNTVFYRRYMERVVGQAKDIVFFEIGVSRGCKDYNFLRLAETVRLLKRMLFFCDESLEYEDMMRKYLEGFHASMDFDGEINKVLKRVYLEIYIASKVFDPDNNKLYKGIACRVQDRFDDVLKVVVQRMEKFEKFKLYVKIIHFMEPEYMARVAEKYKEVMRRKILGTESLGDLKTEYLRIRKQMKENLMNEEELILHLNEEIRKYLHISGRLGFEDEIHKHIDRAVRNGEETEGEIEVLVVFASLMSNKEGIVGKITEDARRRMLGWRGSQKREGMLVSLMERYIGTSINRSMSIMYENQVNYDRNDFCIAGQDIELITETRFLTKGFYDLRASGENLPQPLKDIWGIVSRPKMMKYPRGELECCHNLSWMIFSINGFYFRMSMDKVLIMLWLDVDREMSDAGRCVGGSGFEGNLEYLLSNGFVGCKDGVLSLNRMFSLKEYSYIRKKYKDRVCLMDSEWNLTLDRNGEDMEGEEGCEIVDLFEIEFGEATTKREMETVGAFDAVLEARIMRILKRRKRIEVPGMVKIIEEESGNDEKTVMKAIGKLIEKEYCRADEGYLEYLP
ncbi:Cdc53 cullin-like protein [Encephalitozoon intestinalis ATCC 50506]|uniref:Cdc53 cullin-like protein n=1 Tax=Encephalitozoon intestinalis (strain ATCC 50506) TaxID=876142 RepID=E0S7K9_ENCIT|nr:Cdc53 cullin-like protein [Encephalitozoon intestinalis ATCC 50506]ADM11688.2 Cdc53 cullin-like protein [Encephalitozoon intestinalis ATCC 50506]UTX45425.1 cullin [Encephalitozoon intestinalis]